MSIDGLRVVICPNDHRPPHVHVMGGECEAVFRLNCPDGPPELRENFGFSRKVLARVGAALAAGLRRLCEQWSKTHGTA